MALVAASRGVGAPAALGPSGIANVLFVVFLNVAVVTFLLSPGRR